MGPLRVWYLCSAGWLTRYAYVPNTFVQQSGRSQLVRSYGVMEYEVSGSFLLITEGRARLDAHKEAQPQTGSIK